MKMLLKTLKKFRTKKLIVLLGATLLVLQPLQLVQAQTGPNDPRSNTIWRTEGEVNNRILNAKTCWGFFCGPTIVMALGVDDLMGGGNQQQSSQGVSTIAVIVIIILALNFVLAAFGIGLVMELIKKIQREEKFFTPAVLLVLYVLFVFMMDRYAARQFGLIAHLPRQSEIALTEGPRAKDDDSVIEFVEGVQGQG